MVWLKLKHELCSLMGHSLPVPGFSLGFTPVPAFSRSHSERATWTGLTHHTMGLLPVAPFELLR